MLKPTRQVYPIQAMDLDPARLDRRVCVFVGYRFKVGWLVKGWLRETKEKTKPFWGYPVFQDIPICDVLKMGFRPLSG